ncbi:hypothetical protein PIB30_052499 [Stylosanthes scabra]|uniref:Uncharacterized protein n=1 Tax=Stylosanthes scabra TaxID=79078 RepID=A0ABU6UH08_9FABA|nr:hypothetical protein [Stylosanthes scabra]
MARNGGRGWGAAARGRGKSKKKTGVQLNLDPASHPSISTPTTTTTTTTTNPPNLCSHPWTVYEIALDGDDPDHALEFSHPRQLVPRRNCKDHERVHGALQVICPLFSQATDEAIEFWWEEWRKRFRFRRGDEANMHKAWEIRTAKCHRGMIHNICEKGAPHHWIPDDIFRRCGGPTRPTTLPALVDHFTKGVAEIGRDPTQSEVFLRTHTKKKDRGQFVYSRSEQHMELHKAEMKRLEDERVARIAAGEPADPPIDEDEVWDGSLAVGSEGGFTERVSGPDAREHITLMNREIQQQAQEYKWEMEAWKKRYETNVSRLQTTLDTQSAEFDQWKSHVSQRYTFMQQVQATSSSAMPPLPPPPLFSARPPWPPPATTASAPTRSDTHLDDGSSSNDEDYD